MLDLSELRLIDALHGGFPLQPRPFAQVGVPLRMSEDDVIETLQRLLQQGDLTRFGPLFQIERAGGRFVLAAMQVPEAQFDAVAALVNAMPEVAHNYRRDHRLNMWFVVATESVAQSDQVLARIESITQLPVLAFPKEREFFVELRLPLLESSGGLDSGLARCPGVPQIESPLVDRCTHPITPFERQLMQATQAGLPLVREPYVDVGKGLGVTGQAVIQGLHDLLQAGVIRRIGAVPHHYRLGFVANGMSVWDVDDAHVDRLGESVGRLPGVSHCYRRPRHGEAWPYNLFAMLHGRTRLEVQVQSEQLSRVLGAACRSHDILYSSAVLKKTGLRLRSGAAPTAVEG
jgi:DNA-binding Lrp family transcriptional regulator